MRRKHKVKISVRPKHLLYSLVFLCLWYLQRKELSFFCACCYSMFPTVTATS